MDVPIGLSPISSFRAAARNACLAASFKTLIWDAGGNGSKRGALFMAGPDNWQYEKPSNQASQFTPYS
ncbi:hypothetical protein [Sulfitobacter sp. SH24]|uniref:hypothetical protein n=1 Tax=Sulfitobacter sp. SH24 TaxID=3421173 RepID=UPI003F500BC2